MVTNTDPASQHDPLAVCEMLLATFAGRRDAFNRWFGDRYHTVHRPLTASEIVGAIHGGYAVGAYFLPPSNQTHVAALDFDRPDGLRLAELVGWQLADAGIPTALEPSREGRAHLWLVADAVLPAIVLRRALRAWLAEAGLADAEGIELRPGTDKLSSPDSLGHALRLPTLANPKTGQRYPLCDPLTGHPLGESLGEMLAAIEWAPAERISDAAERCPLPPVDLAQLPADLRRPHRPSEDDDASASEILRELWGVANAQPGRSVRCPAHDDRQPSLSILRDDRRVVCHSPSCILSNDGRGRGTHELRKLAAERAA